MGRSSRKSERKGLRGGLFLSHLAFALAFALVTRTVELPCESRVNVCCAFRVANRGVFRRNSPAQVGTHHVLNESLPIGGR